MNNKKERIRKAYIDELFTEEEFKEESKLIENLYFTGEVIDVDAETGGYNLQIAFSTGYLAGISI